MRPPVLLVDDDPQFLRYLERFLRLKGFDPTGVGSGEAALALLGQGRRFSLVLLDILLPGIDGLEVLREIRRRDVDTPVIMLSAEGNARRVVEAMKLGANDFLTKPFETEELEVTIQKVMEARRLAEEARALRRQLQGQVELVGVSWAMQRVRRLAEQVADSDIPVLIRGESGTGKGLLAQYIHQLSPRRARPFVKISCVNIPEQLLESELFGHEKGAFTGAYRQKPGKFELAHRGTAFLDEVGEIPPTLQVRLLQVLEEGAFFRLGGSHEIRVDIRVLAATNRDLERALREGAFREDLYYRLKGVEITIPPLRERPEDIPVLAKYFLDRYNLRYNRRVTLSAGLLALFGRYHWPGNVRELRNLMERLAIMVAHPRVELRDLPPEVQSPGRARDRSLRAAREEFERRYILRCLEECGYNVSQTAEMLGIERAHLYRKMRRLGISWERA